MIREGLAKGAQVPFPRPGPWLKNCTLPLKENRFGSEDTLICQK
jgi:hypothetical protein